MNETRGRSGAWEAWRAGAHGWEVRRSAPLSLAAVVLLFAAVTALRWFVDGSGQAVALLYVAPIALGGLWSGRRGGICTAAAGAGAFVVLAAVDGRGDLDVTGWFGPILVMLLVGALVGQLVDGGGRRMQLDSVHAEQDRRLADLCEAQRAALATSDSIIQQFAAARWLLEVGLTEDAAGVLGDTVADCVVRLSKGLPLDGAAARALDTPGGEPRGRTG